MPPKSTKQPKINAFTRNRRSKHNSAPGSYMGDIEEVDEFESCEEHLPMDAGLKQIIDKINEIGKRVEAMEFSVFNQETGLRPRMASQEVKAETSHGKLLFMAKEYKAVKQDLTVIKGLVQRQAQQIGVLDSKVVDVTARSMAKNIVISGILESQNENCVQKVQEFLKNELNIPVDVDDTLKVKLAHRIGVPKPGLPRAMVAKINQALHQEIFKNIDDLEGRQNPAGDPYYLNFQQPEARLEAKRNAKAILRKFQAKHKNAKVEIKGDKVYLNNEWQKPPVRAPQPQDLYYDPDEQKGNEQVENNLHQA